MEFTQAERSMAETINLMEMATVPNHDDFDEIVQAEMLASETYEQAAKRLARSGRIFRPDQPE